MDDSAVMGIVGLGGPHMMEPGMEYQGNMDAMGEQAFADQMLVLGGMVCVWLYPFNVVFSVGFMWLCHMVWLCDVLWLPERVLVMAPLLHIILFFAICCAMACAYRERSKRRFQAACDRARLFQEDPQAFFREKKFRATNVGGLNSEVADAGGLV